MTERSEGEPREQTAGAFGGAVSPHPLTGSRGNGTENFEILLPLDARKLLFQHAFNE